MTRPGAGKGVLPRRRIFGKATGHPSLRKRKKKQVPRLLPKDLSVSVTR